MQEGKIQDRVRKLIGDHTHYKVKQGSQTLGNDLGFDSLDCIELIMDLEHHFKLTLGDEFVHESLGTRDWKKAKVSDVTTMTKDAINEQY